MMDCATSLCTLCGSEAQACPTRTGAYNSDNALIKTKLAVEQSITHDPHGDANCEDATAGLDQAMFSHATNSIAWTGQRRVRLIQILSSGTASLLLSFFKIPIFSC